MGCGGVVEVTVWLQNLHSRRGALSFSEKRCGEERYGPLKASSSVSVLWLLVIVLISVAVLGILEKKVMGRISSHLWNTDSVCFVYKYQNLIIFLRSNLLSLFLYCFFLAF